MKQTPPPNYGMTYAGVGVDYETLDAFKRLAIEAAGQTANNLVRHNRGRFVEYPPSRGESVYLLEREDCFFGIVEEGLGTKNIVADAMFLLTGKTYYDQVAQDTVAMIVNDMVTLGVLPLSVAMHLAVGDGDWFKNEQRAADLISGWKKACDLARCTWGGGETPTLKGIVVPGTALLSGSAIGIVSPKERLIRCNIQHGDVMVFIESNGIHANGLTLARKIKEKLPDGYLTKFPDGRTYGETLLDPTPIYVGLVEDCVDAGVHIHYAVNVTGHGWRKFMRANAPFTYVVERLPRPQPIFDFLREHGPMDLEEAYGNLNMGVGFALYVPRSDVESVLAVSERRGFKAFAAGHIEQSAEKRVIIGPHGLEFGAETLKVR